jgi:hypothetical protein
MQTGNLRDRRSQVLSEKWAPQTAAAERSRYTSQRPNLGAESFPILEFRRLDRGSVSYPSLSQRR